MSSYSLLCGQVSNWRHKNNDPLTSDPEPTTPDFLRKTDAATFWLNEIAAGPLTSKTKRKVHTKATKVTLSTILFVIQISERQRG
jgi:hypothetical protein